MTFAVAAAWILFASAPATAPDYSWLIDAEIPARIAAAQEEAVRFDAAAAESDRLKKDVVARRQAALDEKAKLEPTLPALSKGKRSDAEKRIGELDGIAAAQAARADQLAKEAAAMRQKAGALRAAAVAYAGVAKSRQEDDAKHRLAPDADITPLSNARLAEITAYYKRRLARLPKQLAALDQELERAGSTGLRGEILAAKDGLRAAAVEEQAEIDRIDEELRFRADSKSDEDILVQQMEAAAKAKAAERESPVPTTNSAAADQMLDRVIDAQDRKAAAQASSQQTTRTLLRVFAGVAGFGVLGTILFFVIRRK